MRRAAVGVVLVVLALGVALPAGAASPATATQLVRKLTAAKVCAGVIAVDAPGHVVQCIDSSDPEVPKLPITVHAYGTRAAMERSLEPERRFTCAGKIRGVTVTIAPLESVTYLVGPNWWMAPFGGERQAAIRRAIGGSVKRYSCSQI